MQAAPGVERLLHGVEHALLGVLPPRLEAERLPHGAERSQLGVEQMPHGVVHERLGVERERHGLQRLRLAAGAGCRRSSGSRPAVRSWRSLPCGSCGMASLSFLGSFPAPSGLTGAGIGVVVRIVSRYALGCQPPS